MILLLYMEAYSPVGGILLDRKYLEILKKSWKCIKDWHWSRIRLILRAVLLVLAPLLTVLACQTISL